MSATIRIVAESPLAPECILEAARDFSERRAEVFPAVSMKHMEVHDHSETSADVTEGTRAGPIINWERCDYDWSTPGSVRAPVEDSNIYKPSGSSWEITAAPTDTGSKVEMIWTREFKRTPRGLFFGALYRTVGKRIFHRYARDVLANIAAMQEGGPTRPARTTPRSAAGTPRAAPGR
jgi:hypothetical protein